MCFVGVSMCVFCVCVHLAELQHTFGADDEGLFSALYVGQHGMEVEKLSGCQVTMEGHKRGQKRVPGLLEL